MKKHIYIYLLLMGAILGVSCEKTLSTYEGKPTIYFNEAGRLPNFSGEVLRDSTLLSFSLAKSQDSIVRMVITTIGEKKDFDRPYTLAINPASTAREGVHYQFLNHQQRIKKNELTDTVSIRFMRSADMQLNTFLLSFDLKDNDHFSTLMKSKIINNTTLKQHSFINYRWFVNDIIKKPARWLDGYLGVFSRKKLFLMVEVTGVDPAYMDTSISIVELTAYGKYMQRYLNEQNSAGNPIYEEDGSLMVMGPSVQ